MREKSWATEESATAGEAELFAILVIPTPDRYRPAFYLRLDPLTWG